MKQVEFIFSETSVKFDLVNNVISDIWYDVMKEKEALDSIKPRICMEPDFPAYRDIEDTHNTIINLVDELRQHGFDFDWPEDLQTVTQEELNRLHQEFHEKEEDYKDQLDDRAHDILGLINQGVHQMEQIMWSRESYQRVNYAVLGFGQEEKEIEVQKPLTDELREHFCEKYYETQNEVALLLGYNTLGKNFSHCVHTNDTKVVIDGMVRPQEFIFTQVLFRYTTNWLPMTQEAVDKHNKAVWDQHKTWVKDNDLQYNVDPELPKNKYCTAPVLAYISEDHLDLSEEDWFNIWSQQKLVDIKLHEQET